MRSAPSKKFILSSPTFLSSLIGLLVASIYFRYRLIRIKPKNSIRLKLSKYRKLIPYIQAQSQFETGNFSSRAYIVFHNLFGMHVPHKRKFYGGQSTIIEDHSILASYSSNDQAIKDFISYLDFVNFPYSVDNSRQYVDELKQRNYFSSSDWDYLQGLNSYL